VHSQIKYHAIALSREDMEVMLENAAMRPTRYDDDDDNEGVNDDDNNNDDDFLFS